MTVPSPVLLLDRESIASLLTLDDCIAAVEGAFLAHAQGRALKPDLMHVDAEGGEFHVKAGGLKGGKRTYFAAKINGGFFNNKANFGLPNILGLILLFDALSGTPLALLESGLITRLRTGAASAVAAKYLARPESQVVTICGAGAQGEIQLESLRRVLPLRRAYVFSRSDSAAFAARASRELKMDVQPTTDLIAAANESDVIVTATPAKNWFLGRHHVAPGTFIAAVGADSPDKQELEPQLVANASVVCDLTSQCAHVGELHHALALSLMTESQVRGELGQIISGTAPKRTSDDEIIIFDSTGTALQDAAAAAAVYERAAASSARPSFAFWA
jgi:alanine dehydrogenase